jgi:hypothetical protein
VNFGGAETVTLRLPQAQAAVLGWLSLIGRI